MKKMLLSFAALFAAATTAFADLYVTPTGAGNKNGADWDNAFAGIQAAVDAVEAAWLADPYQAIPTIRVADGTYTRVTVSCNIALDVRSENGAAATIIDGFNTNRCVLCYAYGFKTSPTFTGFTLRNGDVTGNDGNASYGGGAAGGAASSGAAPRRAAAVPAPSKARTATRSCASRPDNPSSPTA